MFTSCNYILLTTVTHTYNVAVWWVMCSVSWCLDKIIMGLAGNAALLKIKLWTFHGSSINIIDCGSGTNNHTFSWIFTSLAIWQLLISTLLCSSYNYIYMNPFDVSSVSLLDSYLYNYNISYSYMHTILNFK